MSMKRLSEYCAERDGTDVRPVVSVYVASYCHERFVADCLEGILAQECDFPVEVIVIDDASTDGTAALIAGYAERYPYVIKPVLLTRNCFSRGIPLFHEEFLPRARGEFVAFCEGDDYWTFPGKLRRQVDFLRRHKSYSACFHTYQVRNEVADSVSVKADRLERSRRCGVADIVVNYLAQTATVVGRIDDLRSDIEFMTERFPLDVRIWLAWLHSGKVYGMAEDWSVYRVHKNGISASMVIDGSAETRYSEWRHRLECCYGHAYRLETIYRDERDMNCDLDAWTIARRAGHPVVAVRHLMRAFMRHPRAWLRRYWNRYLHYSLLRY